MSDLKSRSALSQLRQRLQGKVLIGFDTTRWTDVASAVQAKVGVKVGVKPRSHEGK